MPTLLALPIFDRYDSLLYSKDVSIQDLINLLTRNERSLVSYLTSLNNQFQDSVESVNAVTTVISNLALTARDIGFTISGGVNSRTLTVDTNLLGSTGLYITGTDSRISVVGSTTLGTGGQVGLIDISPVYSGQQSITTLGSIQTGTWNAGQITAPLLRIGNTPSQIVISIDPSGINFGKDVNNNDIILSINKAIHRGNILYSINDNTLTTLDPNISTSRKYLSQIGNGVSTSSTTWETVATGISIGDTVTSGTTGSILFIGSSSILQQDNSNLFWDDANNRLGIGLNNPTQTLSINGRLDVRNTALSTNIPPGFILEHVVDYNNPDVTALLIRPADTTACRLYFGRAPNKFFSLNFSGVNNLEDLPGFLISPPGLYLGINSAIAITRIADDLVYNCSTGDSSYGHHLWYGSNTGYFNIGSGASLVMQLNPTGDLILPLGKLNQAVGGTSALMTSVGLVNIQTSSGGIGNAADTTDDTLFTYTLPLNSMSSNGKSVRSIATGHLATNANLKRVKFWFAGTVIADSGAAATSNTDWLCSVEVTRIDSTHVSCVGKFEGGGLVDSITVTPNLSVSDLTSNSSIIKITGASTVTGAANDVLGYKMRTEFMN